MLSSFVFYSVFIRGNKNHPLFDKATHLIISTWNQTLIRVGGASGHAGPLLTSDYLAHHCPQDGCWGAWVCPPKITCFSPFFLSTEGHTYKMYSVREKLAHQVDLLVWDIRKHAWCFIPWERKFLGSLTKILLKIIKITSSKHFLFSGKQEYFL